MLWDLFSSLKLFKQSGIVLLSAASSEIRKQWRMVLALKLKMLRKNEALTYACTPIIARAMKAF